MGGGLPATLPSEIKHPHIQPVQVIIRIVLANTLYCAYVNKSEKKLKPSYTLSKKKIVDSILRKAPFSSLNQMANDLTDCTKRSLD